MTTTVTPAIALTIAGSDPSGGAGIQDDLKTFAAFGVYGASVITALTAQNTRGVTGVHAVPVDVIAQQFEAVLGDLKVAAMKTGMLGDVETVRSVARLLSRYDHIPSVIDPVMVATSGDVLLNPAAIGAVRTELIPRALVITPNIYEAAMLLETAPAVTVDEMRAQALVLLNFGCQSVLLKGGHGEGADAIDVLVTRSGVRSFARPRIATRNTHGTGCTLSAAIAAGLAEGHTLGDAVETAKAYVWSALQSAIHYHIGDGSGPVDHAFARRERKSPKTS